MSPFDDPGNRIGMNLKAFFLVLATASGLHADPVQRLKDMISMRPPVEGVVVETSGQTNKSSKFGIQAGGTWFSLQNQPNTDDQTLVAAGQSMKMTWSFSGNMVQAIPRGDTVALRLVPGATGRLAPEATAESSLGLLSYRTRFGLHVAETNILWDGLAFEATAETPNLAGGKITGRIEVSNSLPVRIHYSIKTQDRVSSRITELSGHDTNGFPRRWNLSIDGVPSSRSFYFQELSFAPRTFPDGEGYTPSLLGENGREFAIFYSNRTQHVVDPSGTIREVDSLTPIVNETSGPWLIGVGVIGVAAAVAIAVTRHKRQKDR